MSEKGAKSVIFYLCASLLDPCKYFAILGFTVFVCFLLYSPTFKRQLPPRVPDVVSVNANPWEVYAAASRKLGVPLLSLSVNRSVIVVNFAEAIDELFNRRSGTFSCRPRWPMAELLGRQKNVGFQYYGPRLLKSRKILNASLNSQAIGNRWSGFLDDLSIDLLNAFFDQPHDFIEELHNKTQTLIVRFTYGHDPDADYLALARKVMHETGIALQPGRWMVDFIPALAWVPAWMPGAGFQKWAKSAKQSFMDMTQVPFQRAKNTIATGDGDVPMSFVQHALRNIESGHISADEDIVMSAAGSLFSAGSDTLIGTILTFIALIARHPDVQARAAREIFEVVGNNRLPDMHDAARLPYVDCIIQECHRFNPAIPLTTHSNVNEDTYCGFNIPKKSWLVVNIWSILHDDSVYLSPERFEPERFFKNKDNIGLPDPRNIVFGFGRRRCPGLHFANAWVFLVVSRILSLYDVTLDSDEPTTIDFSAGLVSSPRPFVANFQPKEHAANLLGRA